MDPIQTLNTTPELYSTITCLLFKKPKYFANPKMEVNPVISPLYEHLIKELKSSGRMINVTTSDGNCLYHSMCKGLIGIENNYYLIKRVLLSFMYMNSEIFLPHINEKYGTTTIKDYCTAMSNDGVWGTDIEILALATILQAPIYTFSRENSNLYRWLQYLPLLPPGSIQCDYDKTLKKLLYVDKPKDFHLELSHYEGRHYDLIISSNQNHLPLPTLSSFTCHITIS